jgi:PilZ domain
VTSLPKPNVPGATPLAPATKPNAPALKPNASGAAQVGRPNAAVKRSANTARPQTNEERRRAQRVLLRMPVLVHLPGKPKPLEGFTHTVSASGAMIILAEGISQGTKLSIENPKTQKKVEAHVVRPPQMNAEGSLVPVEFTAPSPQFWNVFFPPATD